MTIAAPSPTGHLSSSIGEMRAALAADAAKKKGPAAAVLVALLSLLDLIVALLADFRAGRLAAASPAWAASAPCAASPASAAGATCAAAAGTREGPQASTASRERETSCRRPRTRRGVEAREPRTSHRPLPLRRADERSFVRGTLRSTRPEREPGGFRPPNRIAHGRPRWPPDQRPGGLDGGRVGASLSIHYKNDTASQSK
jgi:hypothetical protein